MPSVSASHDSGQTTGEVARSSNLFGSDSRDDGLSDSQEIEVGISSILADTYRDPVSEFRELAEEFDPADGSNCPKCYSEVSNLPAIIGGKGSFKVCKLTCAPVLRSALDGDSLADSHCCAQVENQRRGQASQVAR